MKTIKILGAIVVLLMIFSNIAFAESVDVSHFSYKAAFHNGIYVKINNGTNILEYTRNPDTWTNKLSIFDMSWKNEYDKNLIETTSNIAEPVVFTNVCWAKDRFFAVGGSHRAHLHPSTCFIATSVDGVKWKVNYVATDDFVILYDVVYSKGKYVAVGQKGLIVSSTDGVTWQASKSGVDNNLIEICSDGLCLIALSDNGTIFKSTNGINWNKQQVGTNFVSINNLVFNGENFICFAKSNSGESMTMLSSSDGEKWISHPMEKSYTFSSVICADGILVAVGGKGGVYKSLDGVKWIDSSIQSDNLYWDIIYDGNRFLIVGNNNTNFVIKSVISVELNGKSLSFIDAFPYIENDRVLVPVRFITESLGASVTWNGVLREVKIKKNKTIILKIGENKALVDGIEVLLDCSIVINNNRTFVPLRFISKTFNLDVKCESTVKNVVLNSIQTNQSIE